MFQTPKVYIVETYDWGLYSASQLCQQLCQSDTLASEAYDIIWLKSVLDSLFKYPKISVLNY
jgi:hypothetical protein